MKKKLLTALLGTILVVGCKPGSNQSLENLNGPNPSSKEALQTVSEINDIKNYSQDPMHYISSTNATLNTSKKQSKYLQKAYLSRYFSPWTNSNDEPKTLITDRFNDIESTPYYRENKQPLNAAWIKSIKENVDLDSYPNTQKKAITLTSTQLRLLPTEKPLFKDFSLPGQGFPFDLLQNSSVAPNTPLYVSHLSKDKAWAYVITPFASGWIPTTELAFVNKSFINSFQKKKFVVITKDDISLSDKHGNFVLTGQLGMIFPLNEIKKNTFTILIAIADTQKKAHLINASISKEHATLFASPLNTSDIAKLAAHLIQQPYGWGGLFNNRDCSSMLKDLFTPFGLWLPRNSAAQALQGGQFIDLSQLSNADKEKQIIEQGTPFLTLIWLKGHIMLYIGHENGKALVFHNIWGLKTKEQDGSEGRKIIGKAVITTLEPGKELPEINSQPLLLNRIQGMTLLLPNNN